MDENEQTEAGKGPDARVLQALYQSYLQQCVNLAEENARLQVRVAELEQLQGSTPGE